MKVFLRIMMVVLWIAISAGVVVMMGFANKSHEVKQCKGISCKIVYNGVQPLITEREITNEIESRFGKSQSKAIGAVDLSGIITFLKTKPYLKNTSALVSIEGYIVIKAEQCEPILRFFSTDGQQHFLDRNGRILPVNKNHPYMALVATGEIADVLKDGENIFSIPDTSKILKEKIKTLYSLHYLTKLILADTVLNALVQQVDIDKDGRIQMATRISTHIVMLGDTTNLAEKLDNLKYFYKFGLMKIGWDRYRKINLEFKNQVVCTK